MKKFALLATAVVPLMLAGGPAAAADLLFQQYNGTYGVSTSGWGSIAASGTISTEFIPAGATVVAAYLYQSTYTFGSVAAGGTLGGTNVNYATALGVNPTACCSLQAYRADVTSIVAPVVNGGAGGTYNFGISETDTAQQDGEALIVVYSLASLPTHTIAILDGFASASGDTSFINFATPLDPTAPGFTAHMIIGDGFSCCGQMSTISVNGSDMTTAAGNNDSSVDGSASDGNLITVGHIGGPYTGGVPGTPQTDYNADHEAYDLSPFIMLGDTQIRINTANSSLDDNIFLQVYDISGTGTVITPGVPEPATWAMMIAGFGMVGFAARRRIALTA